MPKYLIEGSYSAEGAEGVRSNGGSARRDAVAEMVQGLGGQVESFYFAFGGTDAFVVVDLPDNATAATLALTVSSSGVVGVETAVLIDPDDLVAGGSGSPEYRAPGA